ncbi:MAG: stage II sporulation protein P [Emergencia sp.]
MGKKNLTILFMFIYLASIAVLLKGISGQASAGDLTALCLESSLPCMDVVASETESGEQPADKDDEGDKSDGKAKQSAKAVKSSDGKPKVLIYHTHATESYLPASSGNYHTTEEENTVRDAGNVLAETLESEGIAVIHDKTLHDNPSYNNSYSRSFETVKAILAENPSIECIIDLHRDATAAESAGPVQKVEGENCAVYSYVISSTTDTYRENKAFLNRLNAIGQSRYDGYTGNILERPYWYNQELSGKSVLIEMGNNRNNIRDVRACAKVFGKILAEALQE